MLKRDLNVDATLIQGRYGEFTVLVDNEPIVEGSALTFLGIVPSLGRVREAVRGELEAEPPAARGEV